MTGATHHQRSLQNGGRWQTQCHWRADPVPVYPPQLVVHSALQRGDDTDWGCEQCIHILHEEIRTTSASVVQRIARHRTVPGGRFVVVVYARPIQRDIDAGFF